MPAPKIIQDLVARFRDNEEGYRRDYGETETRREFLDPFFKALGWDIDNTQGHAEAYKDVVHEDSVKVGFSMKAPDYSFRVGGVRKFFLEAKKPAVNIKEDSDPAFQLRRYAWSAKLPLSVLSNFAEFAVYDCRIRPKLGDKAGAARTMYLTHKDYAAHWDEIAAIFSKDSLYKGSFDKYATGKGKKGTAEVDEAFLEEIERWRDSLAHNIALRNSKLTQPELNFAVQQTIDRIIFLRICEDRGIEPYGRLQGLQNGENVYGRLKQYFHHADERYNSGLFHFREEEGRPHPDELTLQLEIDDKVLKEILGGLYYPDSPYEFSVLPADILGQVYEQFLGKVIRLTAGGYAKIEDKPEVKKAGGVYYTPTYIVDYIVKQTVGKLLEGSTPDKAAKLKILDPACGSGSFLLGAYQYLLDWHRDWYSGKNPETHARGRPPRIFKGPGGRWRLTTAERKRILLNSIYGVDIDPQAVEVTKLSLLLKVLEEESGETLNKNWEMFHERALPDLDNNIKCGNSLVGPDYYEGQQMSMFDEKELERINVFDWKAEFPRIIKEGGFDAVIGNPPWLMAGYYATDTTLDYLRDKFKTAQGKFDMYYLFIERGSQLVSDKGLFGMIVPNKLFHTSAASKLRTLVAGPKWIRGIVDFGDEQIFQGATNYSCILFLQKRSGPPPKYLRARAGLHIVQQFDVPWSVFGASTWHFEKQDIRCIFEKMEKLGESLEHLTARFGTGVQSGADRLLMVSRADAKAQRLETALLRPVYRGRDVRRYEISSDPKLLIFPYINHKDTFEICAEASLKRSKIIYKLLVKNKAALAKRIWFDKGAEELSGKWYGMMYLDSYGSFKAPHILTPALSNRSNFTIGTGNLFATGTAGVTSIIPKETIPENILYLLGVLNSTVLSFYAINHSPVFSGAYYKFSSPYLKKFPIRRINVSDGADKSKHDKIVELVERILDLRKKLAVTKAPDSKTMLQRRIDATDREIDQLVYKLYGLTEEEIKIVEFTESPSEVVKQ